jgi:predicted ATPase
MSAVRADAGVMGGESSVQPIVGRERETGVLAEVIGRIHERGAALVVRGEAGIGKSALLASASVRARSHGMLILTTTGVQAESHLPFAGLHQLLRPLLGEVGELPDPQRDALLTAFGMTSAPAPDPFLIALAALDLVADDA